MSYEYNRNPQTQQMPPQHAQGYQQSYQPQYQQQYQPAPRQMNFAPDDSTSTGQWVLTLFLVAIPIVGLILLFVWAFSSATAKSKQNWARANLVWMIIAIVITIVISVVATVMGVPVADYIQQYYQGYPR